MRVRTLLSYGILMLASSASTVALATMPQISTDPDDWSLDRAGGTVFEETQWGGRSGVLRLGISPPSAPSSFYNWQGYSQQLDAPAGDSFLRGDLWIPTEWDQGTSTDYVRTGLWGSAMPEDTVDGGVYVDADAAFPIISFTNVDGVGRLEVWKTTVSGGVSTGSWEEIPGTANLLSYDGWNTLDIRLLPDEDKVEYLLNGEVFYTWDQPRSEGGAPVAPEQFFAVYLKARNNGVTTFDTYWSRLMAGEWLKEEATIAGSSGNLLLEGEEQNEVTITGDVGGSLIVNGGEDGKQVTFGTPVAITNSVLGTDTQFVFSTDSTTSTSIGGDLEITGESSTKGGTVNKPVTVTGNVNVGADSTYGGNFVVEGTVTNDGTTAPGNSIGLQVSGGLAWSSSSVYAVEVDDAGHADLVVVTSSTPMDLSTMGSVTVSSLTPGSFLLDHDYVIFATGADESDVTGMFNPVTPLGDLAFLTPEMHVEGDYDLDTLDFDWPSSFTPGLMTVVTLTLTANAQALENAAATPNQLAVAQTLFPITGSNAAAAATFEQPNAAAAQQALAQLSGSAHASVAGLVIDQGQLVDDVVNRRLRQNGNVMLQGSSLMGYAPLEEPTMPEGSELLWGELIGGWGAASDPTNGGRMEHRTGGLLMGLEAPLGGGAVLGATASYSATSFTLDAEGASGSLGSYRLGVYGASGTEGLVVRGGASYDHSQVSMDRNVAMVGYTDTLSSQYGVGVLRGFVELASAMPMGETWFEPFVGLSAAHRGGYSYAETGGSAALSGSVDAQLTGWTTVGARLSQDFVMGDAGLLQLDLSASWRHALGDRQPEAVHALSGGAEFTAAGVPLAADVFTAEIGSTYRLNEATALSLNYVGTLAADQQGHSVQAGLAVRF